MPRTRLVKIKEVEGAREALARIHKEQSIVVQHSMLYRACAQLLHEVAVLKDYEEERATPPPARLKSVLSAIAHAIVAVRVLYPSMLTERATLHTVQLTDVVRQCGQLLMTETSNRVCDETRAREAAFFEATAYDLILTLRQKKAFADAFASALAYRQAQLDFFLRDTIARRQREAPPAVAFEEQ